MVFVDFIVVFLEELLVMVKVVWFVVCEFYGQIEVYCFYGGLIDDEDGFEVLFNVWFLDEVYIDYVEGDVEVGLINVVIEYFELIVDFLIFSNEVGVEENVSVGFYVIEFFFWGQDFNDDGFGVWLFIDYVEGEGQNVVWCVIYFNFMVELFVGYFEEFVVEWDFVGIENYCVVFFLQSFDVVLQFVFIGIGVFFKLEFVGECMFIFFDNQS